MPKMTTSDVLAKYPQPLSAKHAEDVLTALIWADRLHDACELAAQLRDEFTKPIIDDNPSAWARERTRQRREESYRYWYGAWIVLLTVKTKNESKREIRRDNRARKRIMKGHSR